MAPNKFEDIFKHIGLSCEEILGILKGKRADFKKIIENGKVCEVIQILEDIKTDLKLVGVAQNHKNNHFLPFFVYFDSILGLWRGYKRTRACFISLAHNHPIRWLEGSATRPTSKFSKAYRKSQLQNDKVYHQNPPWVGWNLRKNVSERSKNG